MGYRHDLTALNANLGHLQLGIELRQAAVDLTPKRARPKKAMPGTELNVGDVFAFPPGNT